jgi:hypothetical protein
MGSSGPVGIVSARITGVFGGFRQISFSLDFILDWMTTFSPSGGGINVGFRFHLWDVSQSEHWLSVWFGFDVCHG